MPAGDLGIQRGLVRWYTTANPGLEARKLKTDGRAIVPLAALATPPATPGTSVTTEEETVFDLPPLPPSGTLTPAKLRGRLTQKIKCAGLVPPARSRLILRRPQGQHLPLADRDGGAHGTLAAVPIDWRLVPLVPECARCPE
jgi:hypothetical protein